MPVEGEPSKTSPLDAIGDEAKALARRLHHTLESISDAFYLLDQNWRFSFLNSRALALLERSRKELEGQNIWEAFPEAVGSRFETSYREAFRNGHATQFQEYFAPLGAWFEVDAYPTPEGLAVYFRDISPRKQAEEDVRISNERFRLIAEATNDVIWDWDLANNTVWRNENFNTLFGQDPAEEASRVECWQKRIHPEDADRVIAEIREVLHGDKTTWVSEYRYLHKDGHTLHIIDRGSVIRDEDGTAIRMVGSMLDLTPQRELEERLRQAQKLEAMGKLTGGIAHDFNNLLTVILGSAELLRDELEVGENPHVLADMISTAAQTGAELTSRLLAFSRKQPLQPRTLDLGELLSGMEGMLGRTLGEHLDVQLRRPAGLWPVEVDAALETAILNLAINARDAMIDGGSLTIETANVTLDPAKAAAADMAPGQYVVLTVSDTGQGIAPEVLPHVFEPFFTTKEVGKGSGLGLSMVYGFVKQSGGHIRIASVPGHGTSVELYFPRSHNSVAPTENAQSQAPVRGNELILVVEDDALVRRHASGLLEGLGYRVLQASSGHSAIEFLKTIPEIGLLFSDIVMPGGMNGVELARMARELRPDLKILLTSGYAENVVLHNAPPAIDLLSKPYSRAKLATLLRKVMN